MNPTHPQTYECLNEVVVDRGSSSFLTNIECYESGRFITRVQASAWGGCIVGAARA